MIPRGIVEQSGRLLRVPRRVRWLSSIMPWRSALKLARGEPHPAMVEFELTGLGRTIAVRTQTSDLSCVEQVFINKQYDFSFPLNPKVIVDAGANIGTASLYFNHKYPTA